MSNWQTLLRPDAGLPMQSTPAFLVPPGLNATPSSIPSEMEYFAHKLQAEKQRNDVVRAVETNTFDFVLLDTRGSEAFANGHIQGAWCVPEAEVNQSMQALPKDRELVNYCWGHD